MWSNQAAYATIRGYTGSVRNVVTYISGAPAAHRPVGFQTPSPGSAGRIAGAIRGGAYACTTRRAAVCAAVTPTVGSVRSGGPPFAGAVQE